MDAQNYKPFKEKFTLAERQKELEKQKSKYPNMIPVIVEINKKAKTVKVLEKQKFLVSKDVKLHEFQQTVRKKLDITNEADALFFFVGNKKIEKINRTMSEIYQESKDKDDGFLYITYSDQEVFGSI
ncbi:hypothetical protein ABPG72_005363 [Tetrahymena utriculariae]